MSNSAYQRAMTDMEKAGINPMLAFRQGGASQPTGNAGSGSMPSGSAASGPAASAQSPIPMQNSWAAALSGASQAANIENVQAQAEKTRAEADILKGTREDDKGDRENTIKIRNRHEVTKLEEEVKLILEKRFLTDEQRKLVQEETKNAIENNKKIRADTRNTTANAILHELAQSEAKNIAAHHKQYPGYNINVKPFIGDVGTATGSAARAFRSFR